MLNCLEEEHEFSIRMYHDDSWEKAGEQKKVIFYKRNIFNFFKKNWFTSYIILLGRKNVSSLVKKRLVSSDIEELAYKKEYKQERRTLHFGEPYSTCSNETCMGKINIEYDFINYMNDCITLFQSLHNILAYLNFPYLFVELQL